jgi:uncharacterized membrane protein
MTVLKYKLLQMRLHFGADSKLIKWIEANNIQPAQVKEYLKIMHVLAEESGTTDAIKLMAYIKNLQLEQLMGSKKGENITMETQTTSAQKAEIADENGSESDEYDTDDTGHWLAQMENLG